MTLAPWIGLSLASALSVRGQTTSSSLKFLTLEQLLDVQVISVSRTPEDWRTAPTAISVLTSDDIDRSGATRLPDLLRLAPGLNVARYVGSSYAVSARGFSNASANKLQVLLDGRSLYTPLFSGVFWEVQDTLLEDLSRIEIVRGPGATMWGANAINGVINIVSKTAAETQGLLATAAVGTEERQNFGLRYGGKVGAGTFYRAYVKFQARDDQATPSGAANGDGMRQVQTGFRADSFFAGENQLTLQGDVYENHFGIPTRRDAHNQGGNLLGRLTHDFSPDSSLQLQLYFDRNLRDVPLQFREDRSTCDLDVQQHYRLSARQNLVLGANYRFSADQTAATDRTFVFTPSDRTLRLLSGFVQDELTLVPERATLYLGSKFEHNDFTGFEWQPSVRLAFTPDPHQTVWAAVSRAVRTPTRVDTDSRFLPVPASGFVLIAGNPDFASEDVIATELGYRVQPLGSVFLDVTTFYNRYDHLRTLQATPPPSAPLVIGNSREAEICGAEISLTFQPTSWWRLIGNFTALHENFRLSPGVVDPTGGSLEANDPAHLASLRSSMDLPGNFTVDAMLRHSSSLTNPHLDAYTDLDLRLGWQPAGHCHLVLVVQNALHPRHAEFPGAAAPSEVQRGGYVQLTLNY